VILSSWEWECGERFDRSSGGQDLLITSPGPRSFSVDWNRSQRGQKKMSSSQARRRFTSWGGDGGEVEPIIREAESEGSTTSTHTYLGRYTHSPTWMLNPY
jgi:hypothetical protein